MEDRKYCEGTDPTGCLGRLHLPAGWRKVYWGAVRGICIGVCILVRFMLPLPLRLKLPDPQP